MAGKRQKHPDLLAFRRGGRVKPLTALPVLAGRPIPRAPQGIGEYAKGAWRKFWSSPVSQIVDMAAHGERLKHWVRCLDAREKMWQIWRERPLVKGSHGQIMANPVWRQIRDLSEEIKSAEEAFGMSPLAQLRLGITFRAERSPREYLRRPPPMDDIDPREFLRQFTQPIADKE